MLIALLAVLGVDLIVIVVVRRDARGMSTACAWRS
jgi:hypothetical protein